MNPLTSIAVVAKHFRATPAYVFFVIDHHHSSFNHRLLHRQLNDECSPLSHLAFDIDAPVVGFDDPVGHGQPQAGSFSCFFRREKRVEYFFEILLRVFLAPYRSTLISTDFSFSRSLVVVLSSPP